MHSRKKPEENSLSQTRGKRVQQRFVDQVRFVGALVRSPKRTGAVAPTSNKLADLMASHIDRSSNLPVLELGPGTGAITQAILRVGVPAHEVYAVEYSPAFCRQLKETCPRIHILQGDAFNLDETLGSGQPSLFNTVLSGLPLLNFDPVQRLKFLEGALDRLPPGRPLVQFSYGVNPPIQIDDPDIVVTRSRWIRRNLPPARAWTYARRTD